MGNPKLQLAVTSFLLLFLELALIRFLPAQIAYLGYYANFILLASFVGLGCGILLARKAQDYTWLFPWALLLLFGYCATFAVAVSPGSNGEIHFSSNVGGAPMPEVLAVPLVFLLVAATVALLAQRLGRLLDSTTPLTAYTWDIVGSLVGIAAFSALAYLQTSPLVWFLLFSAAFLSITWERSRRWQRSALALALLCALLVPVTHRTFWSPYQKITVKTVVGPSGDPRGYMLSVNNVEHQVAAQDTGHLPWFYHAPYASFPSSTFDRVLVIGAGTGNDVAIALQHGASHVDAVEIDPEILRLGHELNPNKPYDDPRVTTVVTDARSFLERGSERYDLVVFGLPDSLITVSSHGTIRLESFLFTREAIAAARNRLEPGGLLAMYNYYRRDWLVDKFAQMVDDEFSRPSYVIRGQDSAKDAVIMNGGRLGSPVVGAAAAPVTESLRPATDDWPFPYLRSPSIPWRYLLMLAMVAAFAFVAISLALGRAVHRTIEPSYFFLGAAFMLLETRSIVQFSLLFGSTWLVNSLVFFAILASVLLAIQLARYVRSTRLWPWYAALGILLGLQYLVPAGALLQLGALPRYVTISAITFAPIFIANILFSLKFKGSTANGVNFASNMLGAAFGGIAEYLALLTGYRNLALVAALLYLIAFLAPQLWRSRRSSTTPILTS